MKMFLKKIGFYFLVASFISNGVCVASVPEALLGTSAFDSAREPVSQENGPQAPGVKSENQEWLENKIVGHRDIQIICGNSRVIHLNREVTRIAIPESEIADAVVVSKQEILVTTKKKGAANLLVWDKMGDIYSYNITVVGDPTILKAALEKIDPQNKVDVFSTEKGYVVRGNVGTVEVQKQIADASKAFSSDSISIVTVNEAKQILLEIRVMEIDRNKGLEFGIDGEILAEKFGFLFMPGGLGALNAIVGDSKRDLVLGVPSEGTKIGGFAGGYHDKNWSANGVIRALESQSIVKVLARPNILVRDGSQAKMLVGGEFPIPTVTQNTTGVMYKEFGTKLTYTPSILNSGKIRFEIQTEVSELDPTNGIQSNGFNIPGITSRKADTTVEIENNKTLMLGGMIQQRTIKIDSGTPYLRKIPWVGKLFSSIESRTTTLELIILITPHIVVDQKEWFDLRTLKKDDLMYTINELPDPPFEEAKALAMEEYLTRFENERKPEIGVELRKFKRDDLRLQEQQVERGLFEKEAVKQGAAAKEKSQKELVAQEKSQKEWTKQEAAQQKKEQKEAAKKAKEQNIAAKKEAAKKAKEQKIADRKAKEQNIAAKKEAAKKAKEQKIADRKAKEQALAAKK